MQTDSDANGMKVLGARPDSCDVKELKERIEAARTRVLVFAEKRLPIPTHATSAPDAIGLESSRG